MEFRKECFVNLKMCACDRKYAKCRTKADAHDKMDFQYISISVYIVRSNARIQRGDRGSGPLSNTRSNPLKFSGQPSQHSTMGHHRHASETPLKAFRWRADYGPLLVIPVKKKKNVVRSDPNGIQERMFRQFKHLGMRESMQSINTVEYPKPMRTRSISKYHFQHRYMIFFEITRFVCKR